MGSKSSMYGAAGCLLVVAVVLILIGLTFMIGSGGKPHILVIGLVMLVIGAVGSIFTVRHLAKLAQTSPETVDERVLALARLSGGEVTVGEVAGGLRVPVGDASASLERLVGQGLAEHLIRGDDLYYAFAGMRDIRKSKKCSYCGSEYSIREPGHKCPSCGGNLEIVDAEE